MTNNPLPSYFKEANILLLKVDKWLRTQQSSWYVIQDVQKEYMSSSARITFTMERKDTANGHLSSPSGICSKCPEPQNSLSCTSSISGICFAPCFVSGRHRGAKDIYNGLHNTFPPQPLWGSFTHRILYT